MVSYGGEYYRIFSQLSFRYGKFILAGTHIIRDRGRLYNAAHLFGPDGSCFIHAKTHITPEEMAWGMTEGQILEPFTIDGVRVGVMICYEAEIPEVATILARKGADILICPSWSSTTAGYWRIRNCCAARCIENLVYAVHCPAAVSIRDARLPPPAAILSPCDPGFPSDGVLAEVTDHRTTVIEASLDLQLLYRNRRGGATTFLDRPRHAGLYRDHAAQLFASTVYEGAADGAAAPASVRVLPANAGSNARDCSRAYEESG
jgi:predicted amidohydrolase